MLETALPALRLCGGKAASMFSLPGGPGAAPFPGERSAKGH
jgi:hypothetical protein